MVKTFADLEFLVGVLKPTSKLFKLRSQTRGVAGNNCLYHSFEKWEPCSYYVIIS